MTTIPGHSTLGDFKGATIAVECRYKAGARQRVVSLPLGKYPQVEELLAQALEAFDRLYEATPDPDPSDGSLSVEGGVDDTPEEGVIVVELPDLQDVLRQFFNPQ